MNPHSLDPPRSSRDKWGIYLFILPILPQKESRDSVLPFKCEVQVRLLDLRMYRVRTPEYPCTCMWSVHSSHKDVGCRVQSA